MNGADGRSMDGDAREYTSLSLRPETYQRVKNAKRGGETFDELLTKMVAQYDPHAAMGER